MNSMTIQRAPSTLHSLPLRHESTNCRYQKVVPETFLGTSWPCQTRAAMIRNRLIDEITNEETAIVALRYMQSKQGFSTTKFRTIAFAVCSIASSLVLPLSLFLGSVSYVNCRNAVKYRKTSSIAKEYLNKTLDQRTVKNIEKLKYDDSGMQDLYRMLHDTQDKNNRKIAMTNLGAALRSKNVMVPAIYRGSRSG